MPRETGYLFGYIGLVVVIVQGGIYGRLSKRYADLSLARTGMLVTSVAMVLLMLLPGRPAAYANPPATTGEFFARAMPMWFILPLSSFGQALLNPSLTAATSKRGSADKQGGTLGVQQSAGALARMLGPVAAGFAFDHFGPSAPMAVAAFVVALAALLVGRIPALERA
jgi:predicted MFS family arabinose efflux permease